MIREAGPGEVEALRAIELACFGPDAWSEGIVRSTIEGARHTVLVDDLEAYGALSVAGDVADLDRIAVLPSRRRQGVARRLLDALCDAARAQGATRVLLEVAADNIAALAFYEAYGFVVISRRAGYYRRGVDAIVMQLELR
jgi:ribosomal-protein-alanine N-acetyltransferase